MTVYSIYFNLSNERAHMNEWTLNSRSAYVDCIEMSFPAFQYYDVIEKSSPTENIPNNFAPFFYHYNMVVQHLVPDTFYQTGYFL